jgi:glycosyltransferase involved in cell wall biosynthesis
LKHSEKPNLLLLTSSFPSSTGDVTCGYIRDFARSLSIEFNVTVLAPHDRRAVEWPADVFTLTRSRSVLPLRLDPFQAGDDLNALVSRSPLAKFAALISLLCFFAQALLMAARADAICSHWMVPSGFVGALISRALGKPHVIVEHSGALHLLGRMRGGRRITRFIIGGSDRIVTVSADLKRKLVGLCPESATKVEVIPMGVNVASFAGEAMISGGLHEGRFMPQRHEDAKPHQGEGDTSCSFGSWSLGGEAVSSRTIAFIGRLTDIKGLDVLLKAIEGLDGLHLIVAGDGEARKELERMALQFSVNASFVGRIGALEREQLLSVCDAMVIPSRVLADGRTEGTPVVCLEAMAAGRVVIASRVGGLAELISDGETGLLFEQGDHSMLKEKLKLALSDDNLRQKIGENARRSAAAYDWSWIGFRFSEILGRALRKSDAIGDRRIESGRIRG